MHKFDKVWMSVHTVSYLSLLPQISGGWDQQFDQFHDVIIKPTRAEVTLTNNT